MEVDGPAVLRGRPVDQGADDTAVATQYRRAASIARARTMRRERQPAPDRALTARWRRSCHHDRRRKPAAAPQSARADGSTMRSPQRRDELIAPSETARQSSAPPALDQAGAAVEIGKDDGPRASSTVAVRSARITMHGPGACARSPRRRLGLTASLRETLQALPPTSRGIDWIAVRSGRGRRLASRRSPGRWRWNGSPAG